MAKESPTIHSQPYLFHYRALLHGNIDSWMSNVMLNIASSHRMVIKRRQNTHECSKKPFKSSRFEALQLHNTVTGRFITRSSPWIFFQPVLWVLKRHHSHKEMGKWNDSGLKRHTRCKRWQEDEKDQIPAKMGWPVIILWSVMLSGCRNSKEVWQWSYPLHPNAPCHSCSFLVMFQEYVTSRGYVIWKQTCTLDIHVKCSVCTRTSCIFTHKEVLKKDF